MAGTSLGGGGASGHQRLSGRSNPDAHPIDSISGLRKKLDDITAGAGSLSSTAPPIDGTAAAGTSSHGARADHSHALPAGSADQAGVVKLGVAGGAARWDDARFASFYDNLAAEAAIRALADTALDGRTTLLESRQIIAGTGLSGGGTLAADRTISMPNVGTPGAVGSASQTLAITTDAQGRVTAASASAIAIAESQVTNLTTDLGNRVLKAGDTMTGQLVVDLGSGALPTSLPISGLRLANADGVGSALVSESFSATGVAIAGRAIGGSRGAQSATTADRILVGLYGYGYDTAPTTSPSGRYMIQADGAWGAANRGTYHTWLYTQNGSTTAVEGMRLYGGSLGINSVITPGNGLLQLASGTTKANGIAAGTDTFLFRDSAGAWRVGGQNANAYLTVDGANTGTAGGGAFTVRNNNTTIFSFGNWSAINGGAYDATPTLYAVPSLKVQTNGTIALTIDSSQNATFAGNVTINGSTGINITGPTNTITKNGAGVVTQLTITNGNAAASSLAALYLNTDTVTGGQWGTSSGEAFYPASSFCIGTITASRKVCIIAGNGLCATFDTSGNLTTTGKLKANGAAAASTMTGMTLPQLIAYLQTMIQ